MGAFTLPINVGIWCRFDRDVTKAHKGKLHYGKAPATYIFKQSSYIPVVVHLKIYITC